VAGYWCKLLAMGYTPERSTYWYLSATPELLALAAQRLERFAWMVPS
jgi:hypothetical protein